MTPAVRTWTTAEPWKGCGTGRWSTVGGWEVEWRTRARIVWGSWAAMVGVLIGSRSEALMIMFDLIKLQ